MTHSNTMYYQRGDDNMKHPRHEPIKVIRKKDAEELKNDLFDLLLEKGYIEKTPYGYYFKPEFYKTLHIEK